MNARKALRIVAMLGGMYLAFAHTAALAGPEPTRRGSLPHAGRQIRSLLGAARLPSLQPPEPPSPWHASVPAASNGYVAADGSDPSDRDQARSAAVVSEQ